MRDGHPLVLVVDDDAEIVGAHCGILERCGCRTLGRTDPTTVEALLGATLDVDLIMLDVRMPKLDGFELFSRIQTRFPQVGIVFASVACDLHDVVGTIRQGAYHFLAKPISEERIRAVIEAYFGERPARTVAHPAFAALLSASPSFDRAMSRLRRFAGADVPLLLEGETGTGKNLAAQAVHAFSARRDQAFVHVPLPSVPSGLFESELFGTVVGGFTGAVDRPGYLERAGDGTLFIDEIGHVPLELQPKLLSVLDQRVFARVGSTEPRPLKARLLFATNRDLRAEMRAGRFLPDLWYRIGHACVALPPLRERPEDVRMLAEHFLRKHAALYGRSCRRFTDQALAILQAYAWPGNVRELESMVSSAALLSTGSAITEHEFPDWLALDDGSPGNSLAAQERRAVLQAMRDNGGNQTKTAHALGISRTALNRRLRALRQTKEGTPPPGGPAPIDPET